MTPPTGLGPSYDRHGSLNRVSRWAARLVLRPFSPTDVDDVFEYAKDPEWAEYLPEAPHPYTRRDAEEFIAGRMVEPDTQFSWAIVLGGVGIGGIILSVDSKHEAGEIDYALAEDALGARLHA